MNNPIIFNVHLKRLANKILSNPRIINNSFYDAMYQHRMKQQMKELSGRPLRVRLGNTNICTANCTFCPHKDMKRKQGRMEWGLFTRLVRETVEWGVPEIVIQEFGEPFVDPTFFARVKYCKQQGVQKVQTNSNCRFITPKIAEEIMASPLDELFISCNKEGWNNVEYLCSLKKPKTLKIYLSGISGEFIPPYKPYNVSGISVSFPHNWAGAKPSSPILPNVRKDPCPLMYKTMYITWDGYCHLCCMDTEAAYKLGNANTYTLKEIWHDSKALQTWREHHLNREWYPKICEPCVYNQHNKFNWW